MATERNPFGLTEDMTIKEVLEHVKTRFEQNSSLYRKGGRFYKNYASYGIIRDYFAEMFGIPDDIVNHTMSENDFRKYLELMENNDNGD